MDLRKIKKLIELVEESAIEELEVSSGDESIRIVLPRGAPMPAVVSPAATFQRGEHTEQTSLQSEVQNSSSSNTTSDVPAPMAGTFYSAPHPDAPPFVEVGQAVVTGEVLCIIESMKMMHEIRATTAGVVKQICVENGQAIGTGETLFRLS